MKRLTGIIVGLVVLFHPGCTNDRDHKLFNDAKKNAIFANEGFSRSIRVARAWMRRVDPETGLFPEKFAPKINRWRPRNNASDNYPFMVLAGYLLDRDLYHRELFNVFTAEQKWTNRVGSVPDEFWMDSRKFVRDSVVLDEVFFNGAEYAKDGLVAILEYVGRSPYSERMLNILTDLEPLYDQMMTGQNADEALLTEINGDLLIALCRAYWLTGDEKFLNWAVRIADRYLYNPPLLEDNPALRLRDHGSEITPGLSELYFTLHHVRPEKAMAYRPILHRILDKILGAGTNADGLLFDIVDMKNERPAAERLSDTWGYVYNAFATVTIVDSTPEYREAVVRVLRNLDDKYRGRNWENSFDGIADAVEGAIYLMNYTGEPAVAPWIDCEIRRMFEFQKLNGLIGPNHCDGNFIRTTLLHALWKTQGVTAFPWRRDVLVGAVADNGRLLIYADAQAEWSGRLRFDTERHKSNGLPTNYPRINHFPEWFTVSDSLEYVVADRTTGNRRTVSGRELREGLPVMLGAGPVKLEIFVQ